MSNECWLKKKGPLKHRQCCCVCKWHIEDFYQCCRQPKMRNSIERKTGKPFCICGIHKGWICLAPELERAHSDWPEHSIGCEMWILKK